MASNAYRLRSFSQEITSHRGKERFASQVPKIQKEPPDSVLTISKVGHLTLNNHALRRALPNSCYYFSGELNADDQMQTLTMCQSGPRTLADKRGRGVFYRRLRQALIDSKKRDVFLINNVWVADVFGNAHIKVNILRG
ncbi:MAG TPA: hypothetical protein VFU09_08470 [Candidatus Udaeobacter sp.]|nr:hypothetical protein [Candidatus Udaeobacter sp.]